MKQKITFGAFIMLNLFTATVCVKAQTNADTTLTTIDTSNNKSTLKIAVIEIQPAYPGGEKALFEYLANNVKYPKTALNNGIEGTVYVQFTINKDGSVTDVKALRGIGGGCTEEALRLIKSMPNWTPGTQQGIPVKVKYTLPIKFNLGGNNTTSTNTTAGFIGGEVALSEYLANNLKYPKKARKKKIEGTVVVNFIVTENVTVTGANILRGIGGGCDIEALRIVNDMPNWIPAIKNGITVRSTYNLPIQFKL